MKLTDLIEKSGAMCATGEPADAVEIDRVYAGDRVSDLLSQASDRTLLVTNLVNSALLRLIELMDVPAICLLNGVIPEDELIEAAKEHHTALAVSPVGLFETCGKLYRVLEPSRD